MDIVTPLTIKEALYHDSETGKAIGTEYWVISANGAEIACLDYEEDARRIVACVNACEGIETEDLEGAELAKFCEDRLWQIGENDRLSAQNTRLLEALKELVNATSDDFAAAYGFEVERNNAFKIIAEFEKTPTL